MSSWNNRLTVAGLLVALAAMLLALDARSASSSTPEAFRPSASIADLRREVRSLRAETERLRSSSRVDSPEAPPSPVERDRHPVDSAPPEETDTGRPPLDELLALGRDVIANRADPETSRRFWELARTPGTMDRLLARLEAEIASSPRDSGARMRLADAYVMKLFTVPPGPEMSLWGKKAEGEWTAVLCIEPEHWQARFSRAVSLSYYPDVMNKTPEAIRDLSRLVEQQRSMAPEPRHADVYRLLAILEQRRGDPEAAARALREGLERHPDDAKIRKAVEEENR